MGVDRGSYVGAQPVCDDGVAGPQKYAPPHVSYHAEFVPSR